MLNISLLDAMLSDDKLFEIAESLPFPALYQFSKVSQRFYHIASNVVCIHIRTYFPYLKEEQSLAYQDNPLTLFKTEFYQRKKESRECNISREAWLQIISGDLSLISGRSNAQACYALAYVSGHQAAFAFLENEGFGRALILAAEKGRDEVIRKLSQEKIGCTQPYGIIDDNHMISFAPLLEKVKFFKEVTKVVPLSPDELAYHDIDHYYGDNFSLMPPHRYHYEIRTKFITERQAICQQLYFEDIAILYAISNGYTEMVIMLLTYHQQHIHAEIKGLVLEHAALNGHAELVKILLTQYAAQISFSDKMVAVDCAKGACRQIILEQMTNHELFQGLYWSELLQRVLATISDFCNSKKDNVTLIITTTTNEWLINPSTALFFGYQSAHTSVAISEEKAISPLNVRLKI